MFACDETQRKEKSGPYDSYSLFLNIYCESDWVFTLPLPRPDDPIIQPKIKFHRTRLPPLPSLSLSNLLFNINSFPALSLISNYTMSLPDYEGKDYIESDPDEPDLPPKNKRKPSTPLPPMSIRNADQAPR